jgi:hypothetical protein
LRGFSGFLERRGRAVASTLEDRPMHDPSPRPEPPNKTGEPEDFGGPFQAPSIEEERALGALFVAAEPPPRVGVALARAAAGVRPRRRIARRRWTRLAPIALAAAAALAVVLVGLRDPHEPERRSLATTVRDVDVADFDASGRVDVWDAYLVARALAGGAELSRALDLDHDGVVTRADADLIAQRAVEVVR